MEIYAAVSGALLILVLPTFGYLWIRWLAAQRLRAQIKRQAQAEEASR